MTQVLHKFVVLQIRSEHVMPHTGVSYLVRLKIQRKVIRGIRQVVCSSAPVVH